MQFCSWFGCVALAVLAVACRPQSRESGRTYIGPETNLLLFTVKGIVRELNPDESSIVIQHEAISNYMAAMTMPFRVRQTNELAGLLGGDEINFRLLVTEDKSWIDQIVKTGRRGALGDSSGNQRTSVVRPASNSHPLMDYPFTNELGHAVTLNQFAGQALAITFFFTRCPIPEFCPRLSKNFEEAVVTLNSLPDAPTNWHFLSVSFDPVFDTPEVLKAYGDRYHYDPKHWSFLTGPADKIAELARSSDVVVKPEGGFYDHTFRTLIIDAKGQLQMSFPVGGNLSDAIVGEILKGAAARNK